MTTNPSESKTYGLHNPSYEILLKDVEEVRHGLELFLASKFDEAESLFELKYQESLYHALGYSAILFMKAVMTLDEKIIQNATDMMTHSLKLASSLRKKEAGWFSSITSIITSSVPSVNGLRSMTPVQRHAELVYAEIIILKAILTLLTDQDVGLLLFVKEGLNIRNSYSIFKVCAKFLQGQFSVDVCPSHPKMEEKKLETNDIGIISEENISTPNLPSQLSSHNADAHFSTGVSLGIGLFNVLLSLLPSKVLKIFQVIGFSGDRILGLNELHQASQECSDGIGSPGIHSEFCKFSLLFYHTLVAPMFELPDSNLSIASSILKTSLQKYPSSTFYLYFSGRYYFAECRLIDAIKEFKASVESQNLLIQLHHLCFWEVSLCHLFRSEFSQSLPYARILLKENEWSKCFYSFYEAMLLYCSKCCMEGRGSQNDDSIITSIHNSMKLVTSLRRKIAGKSIPLEKFVSRKARKFVEQGNWLCLPPYEFVLIWNGFGKLDVDRLKYSLEIVSKEEDFMSKQFSFPYWDDVLLIRILRAVIFKHLQQYEESTSQFEDFFKDESKLQLDHYLAPIAHVEYAKLLLEQSYQESLKSNKTKLNRVRSHKQFTETEIIKVCEKAGNIPIIDLEVLKVAKEHLDHAKSSYSNYSLENFIHMKIHNAMFTLETFEEVSKEFFSKERK